jgi:hypothetical protein
MNRTRNESLANSLAAAHRKLLADLRGLEEMTDSSCQAGARGLCDRLALLRAHLDEHFRLEEQNGYMDAVLARAPQLARAVEALRAEHAELRQSLAALSGEARPGAAVDGALRQKVRQWVGRVREHEQRENLLVEDAFNRDLGLED